MKKNILLFFILSFSLQVIAQKESNTWYFGANAGLNFNNLQAVASSNLGVVADVPVSMVGPISTTEGCFSISDRKTGQFLFASDGSTIYNKNLVAMSNGAGLLGHPSSTSSGIVVPFPGQTKQYYVITVPAVASYNTGFTYSVVDMTLAGGLGDVVAGKKNLAISFGLSGYGTKDIGENVSVVQNSNNKDYWLLSKFRDVILVWAITASGISEPAIYKTTHSMQVHPEAVGAGIGYLKFNIDGTKFIHIDHGRFDRPQSWFTIANFDRATGIVSQIKERTANEFGCPYALEFSPNGEYVYITSVESNAKDGLYIAKMSDIENIGTLVPTKLQVPLVSCVQMGSDGRIYGIAMNTRTLYCILDPDAGGTKIAIFSNYLQSGTLGKFGLPIFSTTFLQLQPITGKKINCVGIVNKYSTEIKLSGMARVASIKWNFGDGTIVNQIIAGGGASGVYTQEHAFQSVGTYTITATPTIEDGGVSTEDPDKNSSQVFSIIDCSIVTNKMIRHDILPD